MFGVDPLGTVPLGTEAPTGGGGVGPGLTLPTMEKVNATTTNGSVSTDGDDGTLYSLVSGNATEDVATVKGGISQAVTVTGVQVVTGLSVVPGGARYLHFAHANAALDDSNVVTAGPLSFNAFAGSATYSGGPIPPDSILYYEDVEQTAADDASTPDVLTDSGLSLDTDSRVTFRVLNDSDGSLAAITANTATTVTGALSGGIDNSWDNGDTGHIERAIDVNDIIYHQASSSVLNEEYEFNVYIYDTSIDVYSDTHTIIISVPGASDGSGTISLDVLGSPTFTYVSLSTDRFLYQTDDALLLQDGSYLLLLTTASGPFGPPVKGPFGGPI